MIGLAATGRFALPVAGGGGGIDRIERIAILKQLIHRSSLAGLDRHCQVAEGSGFLTEAFPSFNRMLELEVRNDLGLLIDDDHRMMVARPIKAGVMSDLFPFFHKGGF